MLKKTIGILLLSAAVCQSAYAYTGVSDWAGPVLDEIYNEQLVPDEIYAEDVSETITKQECAELCVKFYETIKNVSITPEENPFNDDVSNEVLKAAAVGIVGSFSGAVFNSEAEASREEIADMLARTYAAVTDESIEVEQKELFADDAEISSWARDSVYFIQDKSVMNIVGSNKFAPHGTGSGQAPGTSIQSVLISIYKMSELIGGDIGDTSDDEEKTVGELCLEMIPDISFGVQEEPVVNEESAVIVVNDAIQEDYDNYVQKAKSLFPTFVYELPGQNYKAANGDYIINITYLNGVFSAEVLKN